MGNPEGDLFDTRRKVPLPRPPSPPVIRVVPAMNHNSSDETQALSASRNSDGVFVAFYATFSIRRDCFDLSLIALTLRGWEAENENRDDRIKAACLLDFALRLTPTHEYARPSSLPTKGWNNGRRYVTRNLTDIFFTAHATPCQRDDG